MTTLRYLKIYRHCGKNEIITLTLFLSHQGRGNTTFMNLLYIANIRIPTEKAHGYQIFKMCEAFANAGLSVKLITPTRRNPNFKSIGPFEHYHSQKNFTLMQLKTFDPHWLIKLPNGIYIKFQIFFFLLMLVPFLLKHPKTNTVVYTRDAYLLPILQKFFKKVVWEGHSLPGRKDLYLKYYKLCHHIIVVTGELKRQLVKMGVGEDKILVAHDGVDLATFAVDISQAQARQELKLPADKIILGYTGSYRTKNMDKGIADILKALKILIPNIPNIQFVAVGGDIRDISFYQDVVSQIQVGNHVTLLPRVGQDKLAQYQQAFDILMMPFPDTTHFRHYMSPMKMFEYMAAKRPIVATTLPSTLEVLNDSNALLVSPDNSEELAEGLQKLIKDKQLRNKLAQKAFEDVQEYTWAKRAASIKAVL